MLENKEFTVEKDFPNENTIRLINKRRCWSGWWFDKDQLDALIEILTKLKEEICQQDIQQNL